MPETTNVDAAYYILPWIEPVAFVTHCGRREEPVVYGLTKEDRRVFYVGMTFDPMPRLASHRSQLGLDTQMFILQECRSMYAVKIAEKAWIAQLQTCGLLNKKGVDQKHLSTRKNGRTTLKIILTDEQLDLLLDASGKQGFDGPQHFPVWIRRSLIADALWPVLRRNARFSDLPDKLRWGTPGTLGSFAFESEQSEREDKNQSMREALQRAQQRELESLAEADEMRVRIWELEQQLETKRTLSRFA